MVKIQAEDYTSAVDSTPDNLGGAYRVGAVDIEATTDVGGGFNVGWTAPKESLTYTITIPTSGVYDIVGRVASETNAAHRLGVSLAGNSIADLNFQGTGGWQNWTDATKKGVTLAAGTYELRLDIASGTEFNINYVDFIPSVAPPPPVGDNVRLQAEDYANAVDSTPTNLGNEYRTGAVDIESTTDAGGGYNVGWTAPNESLTYTITIPTSGVYDIVGRVASEKNVAHQLGVSLAGKSIADLNFQGTGGWQNWTDVTTKGVTLAAGTYEVRLDITSGTEFNINYVDFVKSTPLANSFALKDSKSIVVNEAAGVVTITAVRTGSTADRATLEYTTNEVGVESAQAGLDYTAPTLNGKPNTGQVVFAAGEAEKSFTIPIINDTLVEKDEAFSVGIQNPSNGTLGTPRTVLVNIVDDDSAKTIVLASTAITIAENLATANLTVQRNGDVTAAASVQYSTSNGTAITGGVSEAIAGADYTGATAKTINFAAGQTSQTISIPIINDTAAETNETFIVTLSNPTGATLGNQITSTVTILDDDSSLGNLTRKTAVTGLNSPTVIDWVAGGQYMLVAEQKGAVRVVDNGTLRSTPLIDLSGQVNSGGDRGLLGMAIHPNFPTTPYVYLSYTYDPPETAGKADLAAPDGGGNRPSRVVRLTVNPTTMVADPKSLVVVAGTNSTWAYTSRPDITSTGDTTIAPSGIANGTTIVAPANQINAGTQDNDPDRPGLQNQNIRDYLATDSLSHTVGAIKFGADGFLYVSNGDGASFNFVDPRGVRVQDINNLSGKLLRIDPITGQGVEGNPFYQANDPGSNQSKVFYSGLRNAYRFTFDPTTNLPLVGDVGWTSWEEINTGPAGSNFGWPYLEGPNPTGSYSDLAQAIAFYNNGNRNNPGDQAAVFPLLSRSHGAPDNANGITLGGFYDNNTVVFDDLVNGTLYAASLDADRKISSVQVFDSNLPYIVDLQKSPDGKLYGADLVSGSVVRWDAG
jgi:glucose/arabinose dehydrogenase